jgi:hypothetical protein
LDDQFEILHAGSGGFGERVDRDHVQVADVVIERPEGPGPPASSASTSRPDPPARPCASRSAPTRECEHGALTWRLPARTTRPGPEPQRRARARQLRGHHRPSDRARTPGPSRYRSGYQSRPDSAAISTTNSMIKECSQRVRTTFSARRLFPTCVGPHVGRKR